MKIFDWIKKLFKGDDMTDKLFEQGAYHESGHIIMAYLVGFISEQVTLLQDDPGSGFTRFNYGQDNFLITSILNAQNDGAFFNSLPPQTKARSPQAAFKISNTLLGGPVTEALHKFGVDFQGNLEIDMRGPDLISVTNIDYFLSHIDQQHRTDFIQHSLSQVINIIRTDQFWSAVKHLVETIMNSPNKSLTQIQIEDSLRQSGYLTYIATL